MEDFRIFASIVDADLFKLNRRSVSGDLVFHAPVHGGALHATLFLGASRAFGAPTLTAAGFYFYKTKRFSKGRFSVPGDDVYFPALHAVVSFNNFVAVLP